MRLAPKHIRAKVERTKMGEDADPVADAIREVGDLAVDQDQINFSVRNSERLDEV